MADVAAARASNTEEIEQLHKDLNAVSHQQEATVKRRETLLSQKEALYLEREQVKAEHEEIIAVQNEQITLKYGSQKELDETKDRINALKSCITAVKQDKVTLQQKMALEREAFTVKKDNLYREVDQAKDKVNQQKQLIERSRGELDIINYKKRETHDHLSTLIIDMLKEVVAKWNEEQSRHQRLNTLTSEFRRRRTDLKLLIQGLKEKTGSLLQPKEDMKTELEELRESYMDVLDEQASELRAVEMSIYDNGVKLEQVSMENSRLHLCIRQMTEDVDGVREDKERYWQEVHQFKRNIKTLFESLQDAWKEDSLVTLDGQNSDGVLLVSSSAMLNHLKTRRQQLGNVSTLLHHQMLDFSKRLGDKTIV
uniref:Uncharacterized protein n=1 Tax=Cyclopterus lumpus TaxID=8103 RepID=A0A8C2WGL7_CYCLU